MARLDGSRARDERGERGARARYDVPRLRTRAPHEGTDAMPPKLLAVAALLSMTLHACKTSSSVPVDRGGPRTFGSDVAFLKKHVETIVLSDPEGHAQAAVVPAYQGRVMTSTASGDGGTSYGWINRDLIASGKPQKRVHAYGGEDRFWLGPEGGQFSFFFPQGASFDLEHWQTPAPIDSEPFELVDHDRDRATFKKRMQLVNHSGTTFDLEVVREVRMRDAAQVLAAMRVDLPNGVAAVAFETLNSITNVGQTPWRRPTGLPSIWILGMYPASPSTRVVVPFETGPDSIRGPIVNDEYFGKVPADRLVVDEQNGVIHFKADGAHRSKIGVGPRRAVRRLGSYDPVERVLTIVEFSLPRDEKGYVNSLWKQQDDPYGGDVVNSYNDGPAQPGGTQLGRFYELETSSPALALEPRAKATHVHRTIHLQGDERQLDVIAKALLGVRASDIAAVGER
jgi:hypothetical protein